MSGSVTRVDLEPALVLHTRDYRNTSLLLELISRDHGRVGLVARGVRGRRNPSAGLLQPFQPLAVSWRRRGELGALQAVESAGRPLVLRHRRLVSGFYANELLMRLLHRDDPQPGVFSIYLQLLEGLAGDQPEASLLRRFERDLLALLGYGLPLQRDVHDQTLVPDQAYRYDPAIGATPVAGPTGRDVVTGRVLIGLAATPIEDWVARQTRDIMRLALRAHIGERPLKSRELYARYTVKGDHDNGASSGQP